MKPDIIVILIDDLGWKDLACTGSEFYETPNLDRLANNALRFTQAYAACPVCSPSRAALLTGKSPAQLGITNYIHNGEGARGRLIDAPFIRHLSHTEKTYVSLLRDSGYATWHVGKWHLGEEEYWPTTHGFDVNIAGCAMGHPAYGHFSPYKIPTLNDIEPGEYLADRLTTEAIELVRSHAHTHPDQPYLLNLWHYAVHTPIEAPPDLVKKYEHKAVCMGIDGDDALIEGEYFPVEHKRNQRVTRRVRQSNPVYAGMIENLDTNIGRLLEAVAEYRSIENTVVIFTSDNGGLSTAEGSPTCNLPLAEGKGWMYDGGTRVPLIISASGCIERGCCDMPVTTIDLFPTLMSFAGNEEEQLVNGEGLSLIPLLQGEQPTSFTDRPLFWHYPHYGNQGGQPAAAVRQGDWKLIRFMENNEQKLFNLKMDPGELFDMAPTVPARVRDLGDLLSRWQEAAGAVLPLVNEAPQF